MSKRLKTFGLLFLFTIATHNAAHSMCAYLENAFKQVGLLPKPVLGKFLGWDYSSSDEILERINRNAPSTAEIDWARKRKRKVGDQVNAESRYYTGQSWESSMARRLLIELDSDFLEYQRLVVEPYGRTLKSDLRDFSDVRNRLKLKPNDEIPLFYEIDIETSCCLIELTQMSSFRGANEKVDEDLFIKQKRKRSQLSRFSNREVFRRGGGQPDGDYRFLNPGRKPVIFYAPNLNVEDAKWAQESYHSDNQTLIVITDYDELVETLKKGNSGKPIGL